MKPEDIQGYLAAALDQCACKATLTGALQSRVATLHDRGIPTHAIVTELNTLCADPYQMNGDVIREVIKTLHE